jgi:AcrR family transcriptional regulator
VAVSTTRRKGVETSEIRAQLLQAAVQILRDEGASAVTTRRLAEQFGLGRHIVHYYFGTIDEVFVAVMREEGARSEEMLREAAKTGDALELLWDSILQSGPVILELMKLAIHHPSIAKEYKIYTERFRLAMSGILETYARLRGIALPASPAATALLLQSVASAIAIEASMGLAMGHEDAEAALLGWLKSPPEVGITPQPLPDAEILAACHKP